jgi:general secretion pathway protein G
MIYCSKKRLAGFTLIELVATVAIVAILSSAALPMLQMTVQRAKENELRANLRQIREAIDAYKKVADTENGPIKKIEGKTGYPPNLEVLVEGVMDEKSPNKNKIRFLRKIPIDPMRPISESSESLTNNWGLRSYESEAENPKTGDDVYDVYSLSPQVGINGVPYAQW